MITPRVCLVFCLFTSIRAQVETRANDPYGSELKDAVNYLNNFGYVNPLQVRSNPSVDDLAKEILQFQRNAYLPETGMLDTDTIAKMKSPRCGVKDVVNDDRRKKRWERLGKEWDKKSLTYRINSFSPDLPPSTIEDVMARATSVWASVADLSFSPLSKGQSQGADIDVEFFRGGHIDNYPFDGPGKVLAHAFSPDGGDIHFDDDERWSAYENKQGHTDLYSVAVHELGHSLGLSHSTVPSAIMYPWYQFFPLGSKLPDDDVDGIQYLYGKSRRIPSPLPTLLVPTRPVTSLTPGIPNACDVQIKAVTRIRGELFIFSDKYYWRPGNPRIRIKTGYLTSKFWVGFPPNKPVDAVLEHPKTKFILLFSGNQYWQFNGFKLVGSSPRLLANFGLPQLERKINAAFVWPKDKRIYLFSNDRYWKLNEQGSYIEAGYPLLINRTWPGLPSPYNGTAFASTEDIYPGRERKTENLYFMKDDRYWKFDTQLGRLAPSYSRSFAKDWIQCERELGKLSETSLSSSSSHAVRDSSLSPSLVFAFLSALFYLHAA